jgi:hypothetical protein
MLYQIAYMHASLTLRSYIHASVTVALATCAVQLLKALDIYSGSQHSILKTHTLATLTCIRC